MIQILQPSDSLAGKLTLIGLGYLAAMVALTFFLPRRHAMFPLLATVCYMPLGQEILVAGFHFTILRLLILAGVLRVICRGESHFYTLNGIDRLFYGWAVASLVLGTLSMPGWPLLTNRLGAFYNAAGVYFLASCWIKDVKTFLGLLKGLALLVIPIALMMIAEKTTTRNVFAMFGGVPEITIQREGHLRCQAAFRHPILAGTFGTTLIPLFVGLWFQGQREKRLALVGILSALAIAVAAASTGPLLTLPLVAGAFACWKYRYRMRLVRRGILIGLVAMSLVMNAPVWYLFAKLSSVTGGTGWHRAWLIDQTVAHFGDWWLVGTPETAEWDPTQVLDDDPLNIDITNQFISEGVRGGIVKLALFLALIIACFKAIGRRVKAAPAESFATRILFWAIGVSLFAHCLSFLSITYFDQMAVVWCWLLAVTSRIIYDKASQRTRIRCNRTPETVWSPVPESPVAISQGMLP